MSANGDSVAVPARHPYSSYSPRLDTAQPTVADVLALLATFPHATRSKEDIDRQIAEERASWDRD